MKLFSSFQFQQRLIAFLLLSFSTSTVFSQTSDENYLHLNESYIKSYFRDGVAVAKAPFSWNNRQWLSFAAFGGATILLYTQDDEIQQFFSRNQSTAGLKFSANIIDPLATWYLAGIVGGMYVYGLAAANRHTETAALLTAKSVILAGTYALIFKGMFQRQRPNHQLLPDKSYWGGPFGGFKYGAFPSGHATVAFAAATTISAYYNDKFWIGLTAYSLAGLVAVSRMYENKHWSSDVFAGAVLGYAIGRLVYHNYNHPNLTITPAFSGFSKGVALQYNF